MIVHSLDIMETESELEIWAKGLVKDEKEGRKLTRGVKTSIPTKSSVIHILTCGCELRTYHATTSMELDRHIKTCRRGNRW